MNGFSEDRKSRILYELDNFGKVSVRKLAERLKVTPETIRRDLDDLEGQRKLKRIHGGAIKISYDKIEPSYMSRQNIFKTEKKKIGMKAASLISDGDIIALDVGTTTCEILNFLEGKSDLTVLLNSVFALNYLIERQMQGTFHGKIIFLGGEINIDQMSCFGPISENLMTQFYVDKAFIAIGGMSIDHGITGYDIYETNLSKMLIQNAKEVIVVSDRSKIGVRNFYKVADFDAVDIVISDTAEPSEWSNSLEQLGVQWLKA
ncbi:DeoR/GlpR family DNA-binding transcription regulator [Fusibacter sp. 3D3]|uniref:DeoR/GlpR family DNA-binding transcription regulator n=1 Tax=Fusibacter sp. 3D3 TaxID=1048380 RepID=UPI000853CD17|nr:DeoR/GlpR family DNA-binding transcription regulator [Fusibacter sp. 3D3]GAU79571.1 transcriptional repressor of the fructose operon [Fusibacter sp. 3D3]